MFLRFPFRRYQTNADKIRHMSDKELAGFIARLRNNDFPFDCGKYCSDNSPSCGFLCSHDGVDFAMQWLKEKCDE